jgi:hypothetical protein
MVRNQGVFVGSMFSFGYRQTDSQGCDHFKTYIGLYILLVVIGRPQILTTWISLLGCLSQKLAKRVPR